MLVFLVRRLVFGLVAMFLVLSGSFFFWTLHYWPRTPAFPAYLAWLKGFVNGHSLSTGLLPPPDAVAPGPAHLWQYVCEPFGRTLLLLLVTFVLVVLIAVPLGTLAAARRDSTFDTVLRVTSYAAWTIPAFLVALILQDGLAALSGGWGTDLFPRAGWAGECPGGIGLVFDSHRMPHCPSAGTGLTHIGLVLYHLTLPALSLALGFIGLHARYLRSALLDTLSEPYIAVARSKGLSERAVLFRHALRNALVTFVPVLVSDFGLLLGGSLVVDIIFRLGGLGEMFIDALKLTVEAFVPVDTNALQLALLLGAGLMFVMSVLGEVALWFVDPRTRPE
ncbi:MAG: peptide/nickel transport system permease protein [Gaiellaceae bacterium]|jgi:peptide/nickel transport system permease protein|nr:peptide/nickel transport system permease protein [Gaiellaceae bacterium]